MENEFDNYEEENHINPNTPDVDLRKKQQGKMLAIVAVASILLIGAIIIINMNLGKEEKDEKSSLEQLTPLQAEEKNELNKSKYPHVDNYHSEGYADGVNDLTGTSKREGLRSNEGLTEEDYMEVTRQSEEARRRQQEITRNQLNQQNQAAIRNANSQIKYNANPSTPLYRKSPQELEEERLEREEREFNRRATERVLTQMEKSYENPNNASYGNLNNASSYVNAPKNNRKNDAAKELELLTNENSIGTRTTTGFYTETKSGNSSNIDLGASFSAVPAVIHGKGDGVVVQTGSSVTLRLLADTQLNVGGTTNIIRKNTLINGVVSIGNDRVQIQITSLRIGNNLIPVKMVAYDIDGVQGLYIPNLRDKNMAANEVGQVATRPFNGSIFSTGSVGNQVATQLGVEASRSVMQGATNMVRRKMQQVKVTIKPNYKVLLKSGDISNSYDTQDISNY